MKKRFKDIAGWLENMVNSFEEISEQKKIEPENESEPVMKDEKNVLAEKICKIRDDYLPKLQKYRKLTIDGLASMIVMGIVSEYMYRSLPWDLPHEEFSNLQKFGAATSSIMMLVCLIFVIVLLFDLILKNIDIHQYEEQLRQAEDDLDILEVAEGDNVKRSEKLFRNHQRELKRYYDTNLKHYKAMFPVGIVLVFLGAIIIGGTIWVFRDAIENSIAPILIGAVSGVLVDFIGAVLIHMYTETVKSSIAFHSQLMKSNHALFANMLAFKIKDESKQDDTFAELAKLMIESNVEPKK